MKDLDELHHFLGIAVQRRSGGLFLSQRQYTLDILERANMTQCKPCSTPVDTQTAQGNSDSTGQLQMVLLRLVGCDSYFWNFTVLSHGPHLSIVTM